MADDKYYPEDDQDIDETPAAPAVDEQDDIDDSELNRLLDFLVETLTVAPAVPMSKGKRMVPLQMCLDIVDDIRNCLPDQIRRANDIVRRRDRIIRDAEASADSRVQAADARANAALDDANKRAAEIVHEAEDHAAEIVAEAQNRARAMIDQSEITRAAREEASQICEDARADANDQRLKANRYAVNLLNSLEQDVQATLDAVHTSLENISGQHNG